MAMKDMKRTRAEIKEAQSPMASQPEYPWGLSITLDDDSLKKLQVDELPVVGGRITIVAVARVTSVNSRSDEGGEDSRCVTLQIEKMRLGGDGDGDDDDVLSGSPKATKGRKMPKAKTIASMYEESKD